MRVIFNIFINVITTLYEDYSEKISTVWKTEMEHLAYLFAYDFGNEHTENSTIIYRCMIGCLVKFRVHSHYMATCASVF